MKLAINGGSKVRTKLFPNQNTMDHREREAVDRVFKRGRLSYYRGNYGPGFNGGPEIQALEYEFCGKFNSKHAIACNSATSGLHIAYKAVNFEPCKVYDFGIFDRDWLSIVTPWSMTCSASVPIMFGDDVTFGDIEKDIFCLSLESIKATYQNDKNLPKITTIIPVSLFGQPYDQRINAFAKENGMTVIEDAAQAIGSKYKNKYAGTLGDIGIFSFNFGKHINCGEGGMILTDSDELAMKCRLIMNHAEAVLNDKIPKGMENFSTAIGFNMRMIELQAAIVRVQLEKFDELLEKRLENVKYLQRFLPDIPCIENTTIRKDCTHSYYVLPFLFDSDKCDGIHRDKFIEAVKAELSEREGRDGEGVPIACGYIKPLYRMPFYDVQENIAPNCERLQNDELFLTLLHSPNSTIEDMKDVVSAFEKVWGNRGELK